MKYTVTFDEKTLIDLIDDAELANLFQHNERSGHVYIACKENDNVQETFDEQQVTEELLGGSEQSPLTNEALGGPSSLPCRVQSAPTPMPELNSLKWKKLLSGVLQTFAYADAFREALYKYSIAHKFQYKFLKNSKDRMSVKCKIEGCLWKITANAIGKQTPFLRVTQFQDEHVHHAQDNLQVIHARRASLTSSIIIEEVRSHIDKGPNEIRKTLQRDYGVNLTYKQAYAAKEKALEEIQGRPEQSYMLIPWICQRLKDTDPKTVAEWVASHNNIFERVFIAYGCCIEGFMVGARHILYIDGTHLSGPYKGTLLSASAYDADNELLPFAIGIVKGETYEDWTWFLVMIKKIIGLVELTIVSDRHNAIIRAVREIFGGERHAFCYRHVKENFSAELMKLNRGKKRTSAQSKDDTLKLLDDIAYARLESEFNDAMENMRSFSSQLFQWLENHGDVDRWALSKFPFRRWDNITTNLAESFNAWMVKERRHNVAQLIHEHREKVAKKMYASSMAMRKWKTIVGPNIESKVREHVARAEQMLAEHYGDMICVHTSFGDLQVDLRAHQCSCAAWQMSGIPCPHACTTIKLVLGNVYDYVEDCYKITTQEKIYRRSMIPVITIDMPNPNNLRMENIMGQIFLQPPQTSRPPGRPRTTRRESQFQNTKTYHCSRCHQAGHTKKTCKNLNPC
ncbi:uncharacterized protein LOC114730821 [Neltuma alba]|uniref:uncharacterized protein LOC114730821 n=1 Tax=Neltuma alba TaxID=207710 RepID=UPI0010A466B4|nr:uncharacterized protein LOC114730821 [Prosopis alba]